MIKIGGFYKDTERGGKVEVIYSKLNNCGNTVYACHCVDTGRLFWRNESYLQPLGALLPVQQALLDSDKKKINIVACGVGAGVTTGFIHNIITNEKSAVVVCKSNKQIQHMISQFLRVLKVLNIQPLGVMEDCIALESYIVIFNYECQDITDVKKKDVYIETPDISFKDMGRLLIEGDNLYVSCIPFDLISGYSVTTDKGYYEVENCPSPALEAVILSTGKIPQATPFTLEKYLGRFSNLITGYNYTTNYHLDESFGECVEELDPQDSARLKGAWVIGE